MVAKAWNQHKGKGKNQKDKGNKGSQKGKQKGSKGSWKGNGKDGKSKNCDNNNNKGKGKGKQNTGQGKGKGKGDQKVCSAIAPGHYAKDCWNVVRAAQTGQVVGAPKIKDKACSNRHSNLVSSRHSTELRALQVTALIPLHMFLICVQSQQALVNVPWVVMTAVFQLVMFMQL